MITNIDYACSMHMNISNKRIPIDLVYIEREANENRIPICFFFSLISMKYTINISIPLKLYVIEQKTKRNDLWIEI